MSVIYGLIDFILHIDQHLVTIIDQFGIWTYVILFLIVFIETGLVIFPFLPGDSLLFAASALAALPAIHLNIWILIAVFAAAAIIGDTVNYEIGKKVGLSIPEDSLLGKVLNKEKMEKAEAFFNKHGGKTILIARFMPFIRTFAPFIAGASRMHYGYFIRYNFIGGAVWVLLCCLAGFFFGNIPYVRDNFTIVVLGIIFVSLIPMIVTFIRGKMKKTA
ncbi:cytochrome O ubiquinol oxidase [Carnobacterium divergens]|uniref:Membrane-associated protein n=2 Tax=Carnobacterium divergens TaxID=2748 RepID=A0A0R2HY43_CARDV|nr:cytochrome O ubiquinol oxidase [Carnobacterium divergens]KRN57730.1 membrane-associated protein [Carnobacterium divergens DSM 20623]MDT1940507.1 DedA family protein [Carnobacterium divergens]MDT1942945.1 DedA family protein [Carnobacterium divergens]MDT1948751.1 DedA family protein [Carnobacterium divergens]